MISNKIDELITSARSSKDRDLLNILTMIKAEFQKVKTAKDRKTTGELTEVEEAKALLAMVEQREGVEPGMVLEVLQKGYIYKDKVIRPAMVKVSE